MEEENRDFNVESEQGEALTKEQILERSRKENSKNGDERQRDRQKFIPFVGFIAGVISLFVVEIIYIVLGKPVSHLLAIMSTMLAAQSICQACVFKRLKMLFIVCAIVTALAAIMQWISFGLQLAGIDF